MTTTTTSPRPAPTPAVADRPARDSAGDLSFAGTLRGEWLKLLSLRSTWWTLAMTVAVMALLAVAQAYAVDDITALGETMGFEVHGAEMVVSGFQFGMVTVAVLGALLMTGEYSTGMVRATFAAVPSRLPVLWAKALALLVVTVAVSAVSVAAATLAAYPWLADESLLPALDDAYTWQVLGGMTYFFVAAALLALGIGAVLRHTAGTITAVLGLLLLLPGALQFVTISWVQDLVSVMPLPAAMAFIGTDGLLGSNDVLSPWQGVAVVGGYAAAAMLAGAVCLRRRDA